MYPLSCVIGIAWESSEPLIIPLSPQYGDSFPLSTKEKTTLEPSQIKPSQIHLNVSQKRKVTNKKEWDEKVDKIKEESTLEDF